MVTKERVEPRISVNKLAQYITSRAARQNQILHNAKYPPEFITAYYREASEAISLCLASNLEDMRVLEQRVQKLDQIVPKNVHQNRMVTSNIDAIESFAGMMDNIDFLGAEAKLGSNIASHLVLRSVHVSVRPEITLHGTNRKNEPLVGGIKLHFPKTEPLDKEQAGYVSALTQIYCRDHLYKKGDASYKHCIVIDIASRRVFPGAAAFKKRLEDAEGACAQIAQLWPNVT